MQDRPSDTGEGKKSSSIFATENNGVELARQIHQTQLVIELQEEIFPDQLARITPLGRILDVACGPGGWAIEAARTYPDSHVVGFDIFPNMIEYAQMFAEALGLTNVEFRVRDARKPLDFPAASFDLVNCNYLYTFMEPRAWPAFLQECKRVLRPGGVVKITELEYGITSSPPVEELYRTWARTMKLAGRSFSCDGEHHGTTAMLRPLLRDAGYDPIGHKAYALDCSSGSRFHQAFLEEAITISKHMQPFVRRVAGEQALHRQQELIEESKAAMHAPDFCGIVYLLTAWGGKPAPLADRGDA